MDIDIDNRDSMGMGGCWVERILLFEKFGGLVILLLFMEELLFVEYFVRYCRR